MRYCPSCQTQYTDDTLRFCLQDGSTLIERLEADTPTVAFGETNTVVSNRRAGQTQDSQVTSWRAEEPTRVASGQASPRKSNVLLPVFATAAVMFLLLAVAVIGIWIYMSSGRVVGTDDLAKNTANLATPAPSDTSSFVPTPVPTPTTPPQGSNTPYTNTFTPPFPTPTEPPPTTDKEGARRDVAQSVYGWKSMAESRNLNAYMGNYADTVDYYRKPGSSVGFVRSDKARAFSMYSSMRINISNMSVTVDDSGTRATAVFDKEWNFQGSRNSSGKVRSQLQFRNSNGRWLITGERDLKVYYVN